MLMDPTTATRVVTRPLPLVVVIASCTRDIVTSHRAWSSCGCGIGDHCCTTFGTALRVGNGERSVTCHASLFTGPNRRDIGTMSVRVIHWPTERTVPAERPSLVTRTRPRRSGRVFFRRLANLRVTRTTVTPFVPQSLPPNSGWRSNSR